MGNQVIRDYLRQVADTAPVVGSVCTGALIVAAAGLPEGRQATTHWAYHRLLERLGATYLPERWVEDGKFITSAGIDMALALVARLSDEPIALAWSGDAGVLGELVDLAVRGAEVDPGVAAGVDPGLE